MHGRNFYLGGVLYDILEVPWRVGGQVGRTIYIDPPNEEKHPSFLIGMMDSEEIAQHVVECHNLYLQNKVNHGL